ncbi:MAG: N-acetyl-gamma-glutamyl-phosphate reductase, partial [Thermoguttaceae bacterium]
MKKIAILGATGYTALELIKILLNHPHADIVALTSREDTRSVCQVHPFLTGRLNIPLENLTPEEITEKADCVFSCLPHTATAKIAPRLLKGNTKVIDLSADYRLDSADIFEKWYNEPHPDSERLGKVPYGLPELFRNEIISASLIANPGCYPTSAILPLAPLLQKKLIQADDI